MTKDLLSVLRDFSVKSKPMRFLASALFFIFISRIGINPAKASSAVQAEVIYSQSASMVAVDDCSTEECQMRQTLVQQLKLINRAKQSSDMRCYATAKEIEEQLAEMYDKIGVSVVRFSSGWMNIIHSNCGF